MFLLTATCMGCWLTSPLYAERANELSAVVVNDHVIKGEVVDTDGNPLPGVSVVVKGTHQGVATDMDGRFSIRVPQDGILQFTYIGMKSAELKVSKNATLKIVLENNSSMLNEVVVTGYQDIVKEKLTGSVTTVSADALKERYTPNLLDNLEGRIAGLSTYGGKALIRGTGTLYGSTSPLLVVDGLPIEGSIDDLNPYDIESVNVLKDAAASAIYGARAANGIIVVTTKNAKKKGKTEIDFSANLTIYEKANVNYGSNFYMNAEEQVNAESDYWNYYFFDNDGEVSNPIGTTQSYVLGGSTVSPIQYAYYQLATGAITQNELNSTLAKLKTNNYAKEYADKMYRQQVVQQYNLSLRNSSERSRNNVVVNYKHDNMGKTNQKYDWINLSYKGSFDLAKWLTANVSINSIISENREPGSDYTASFTSPWSLPAYESLYNEDGSYKKLYTSYSGNSYWSTPDGYYDLGWNPVEEIYNNTQTTKTQNMRYHGELLFKIIKGLTVNTQFVYEQENSEVRWLANADSHLARSMRNAYTVMQNGTLTYLTPKDGGFLSTTNTHGNHWTARGQVNYTTKFLDKHEISAIAGLEFRQTKSYGTKSLVLGYDDQLQNGSTQSVDFGTLSQLTTNSNYMSSIGGYSSYYLVYMPYLEESMGVVKEQLHRYGSGYINLTYTYDDRYNVFGSYRKDYADVYGLNAKFRGKPLWSLGAGWNMHNEEFLKGIDLINFLKLRLSYGVTGNIYQGATSYLTATTGETNRWTNLAYGEVESPANPSLKWEQTRTTNIGVDFGLLNYRLKGSIDYYNKATSDVFNNKTLDPTTGYSSIFANVASIRNRGVEVAVSYDWFAPKDRRAFGWTTSATFAHNKNVVTDVENPATQAYQLINTPYVKGYPVSALWSYRFAGISDTEGSKGQTLWYTDNDATVHSARSGSVDVLEYSGQTDPKVTIGLDNTFRWNNFSLELMMAYYGGHQMRALCENEQYGAPYEAVASYFNHAWTPENPTNTPGFGRYGSSIIGSETAYANTAIYDADFIKIRNLVLSYDIPENLLRNYGINRCALSVQLNNPKAIWTKNNAGIDPETLGLRNPSSFVFGLNINL